jgi:ABC-type glycerol-3-phosphate transport system permease component
LFRPETILERKSTLFSIVITGVIAILALPIIVPHLLHGYHLAHIFLHVGGITLAVFISVLAGFAYSRLRTKRLLLSAIAFANFIAAEVVLLVDATWPSIFDIGDMTLPEVGHLLTFITLGLLALGVFRND